MVETKWVKRKSVLHDGRCITLLGQGVCVETGSEGSQEMVPSAGCGKAPSSICPEVVVMMTQLINMA